MKNSLKLIREFRLNGFDKINYTDSEVNESIQIFYSLQNSESDDLKENSKKNRRLRLSKKVFSF